MVQQARDAICSSGGQAQEALAYVESRGGQRAPPAPTPKTRALRVGGVEAED